MYAVIQTGGKQYRVQAGDIIEIEKLSEEVGKEVNFSEVLFASKDSGAKTWLGKPFLNQASVKGQVLGQGRGEKALIVKFKRRKGYHRKKGHRQDQTHVLITAVSNGSGEEVAIEKKKAQEIADHYFCPLKPRGGIQAPAAGEKQTEKKAAAPAKKPAAKKKTATKKKKTARK